MRNYSWYNLETGQIKGKYVGRPEEVKEGYGLIEGFYSPDEYTVVDGQPQPKSDEEITEKEVAVAWAMLRSQRTKLLSKSDWTQVPDAPVDSAAWATYRQQLRDLPANTTDPRDVTWPVPPL